LTINGSLIAESATYAVLFDGSGDSLSFGTRLPDELFSLCQSDGGDICFTSDSAGTEPLPVEIVTINTGAKTAEIWVAVPLTASTNATIYVWYQSSRGTLTQPAANSAYGSQYVWVALGNYETILHGNQTGAVTYWLDSSPNGAAASNSGGMPAAGKFSGGAMEFAAAGDFGWLNTLNTAQPFTFECWFKSNSVNSNGANGLFDSRCESNGACCGGGSGFYLDGNGKMNAYLGNGAGNVNFVGTNADALDGNWHYAAMTISATQLNVVLDGVSLGPVSGTNTLSSYVTFGNAVSNVFGLEGVIDEVRFTSATRSANYLSTQYNIQSSTSLVTVGTAGASPYETVAPSLCNRKCALTINGSLVAESGTYAVLFDGSGGTFGTRLPDELFELCQSDGGDICFTSDSAGVTYLPMELVWIDNSNKKAEIWVAVPLTADTNATVYVWYQSANSGTILVPVVANSTYGSQGVWNAIGNMFAVYHFGSPTVPSGNDSTANGLNLTDLTEAFPADAGYIGGDLPVSNPATVSATTPSGQPALTVQQWFKIPTANDNYLGEFAGIGVNSASGRWAHFYEGVSGPDVTIPHSLGVDVCGGDAHISFTADDTWHFLVSTNQSGNNTTSGINLFLDGIQQATTVDALPINLVSGELAVGCVVQLHQFYAQGNQDEVRFATVQRSANYIATDYQIQSSTSLVSVGTPANAQVTIESVTSALSLVDVASAVLLAIELPLTPIMTSDTAPLGVVTSTTVYSGSAYTVFDNTSDTSSLLASFPAYWQYEFQHPQNVQCFALQAPSSGNMAQMPKNFWLMGSNDGINWTTVAMVAGATWTANQLQLYAVTSSGWYTRYRLRVSSNNGDATQVILGKLYLFGPSNLVPVMSSNTAPFGTASSSDSSTNAYKAFGNSYANVPTISAVPSSGSPVWWQYQFPEAVTIQTLALWAPADDTLAGNMPQAFSLQGSNDGSTWTTLTIPITSETNWNAGERRAYEVTPGSYTYYRLNVTANNGGDATTIGQIYLIAEAIPAIQASDTLSLTLGHTASFKSSRHVGAIDSIVLHDAPYHCQSGRWSLTPSATSGVILGQAEGEHHSYEERASSAVSVADHGIAHKAYHVSASGALAFGYVSIMAVAKRVPDHLVVSHTAHVHKIGHPRATDLINIVNVSAAHDNHIYPIVVDPILTLGQRATARNTVTRANANDLLKLKDAAVKTHGPTYLQAKDVIPLLHTNKYVGPHRVGAVDLLQTTTFGYDPNTYQLVPIYTGLNDLATFIVHHAVQTVKDRVVVGNIAYCGVLHSDARPLAATDSLVLHDLARHAEVSQKIDAIRLGDMATVAFGKQPIKDPLILSDKASYKIVRIIGAVDHIVIEQSFNYFNPTIITKRTYSPFVGPGTAGNPIPPPAILVPPNLALAPKEFTLVYPASGTPTDTLKLRAPEFGNKDRLKYNRICRETRGGTLVIFADPVWPKLQIEVLTFSALTPKQAQDLLKFMVNHIGLEIGMWDWEGRYWVGVITNPNEAIIQDSKYSFTASLEFEGYVGTVPTPASLPTVTAFTLVSLNQPYQVGAQVPIQWTCTGVSPGDNISLCFVPAASWSGWATSPVTWIEIGQVSASNGAGSYEWNTPDSLNPGLYYIGGYLWHNNAPIYSLTEQPLQLTPPPYYPPPKIWLPPGCEIDYQEGDNLIVVEGS
jgi:hypothetical protein